MTNLNNVVIDIEDLTKNFYIGFWRKKVPVLNGVNLQVYEGETFGLLGPNGAGKTTTIKTLVGLVRPGGGKVSIYDGSPHHIPTKAKIGYLPEHPSVYGYLTGYEFMELCGRFFNLSPSVLKTRIPHLLSEVKLSEGAWKKYIKTYSKGMMQRLGFAQALINDPDLLLLDEPMSGLDPLGRHDVKELILNLKQNGKTILFNSHILSDIEAICDRAGILVNGEIVKTGSIQQLLRPLDNLYHVLIKNLDSVGQNNLKRISLKCIRLREGVVEATFNSLDKALKGVAIARQSGGLLVELKTHQRHLEDIFVDEVNKANAAKESI